MAAAKRAANFGATLVDIGIGIGIGSALPALPPPPPLRGVADCGGAMDRAAMIAASIAP